MYVCVCVQAQALQQQPPPDCRTGVLSIFRLGLSPPVVAPGPIRFLISAAIVMKACSTFVAFLALVSRKGIAKESANSFKVKRNQSEALFKFCPTLCLALMYNKCQKVLSTDFKTIMGNFLAQLQIYIDFCQIFLF